VALLNIGYFGVEFAVAVAIGSVSLFADSIAGNAPGLCAAGRSVRGARRGSVSLMASPTSLAMMIIITATTSQTPADAPDKTKIILMPYGSMQECFAELQAAPLSDTEKETELKYKLRVIRVCAPMTVSSGNSFAYNWETGEIEGGAIVETGPYKGR
jgi:hypothetical protein